MALVKRAHGRAAHNSRSSLGAQCAYLVSAIPAVVAVSLQSCTFQIQEKKSSGNSTGSIFGQPGTGGGGQGPRCVFCSHMDRGAGGLTGRFPVALENGGAKCHNLQQRRLAGDPSHQSKSGHAGLVSRAAAIEVPLGRTPAPSSRTSLFIGTRCELETR